MEPVVTDEATNWVSESMHSNTSGAHLFSITQQWWVRL